jgi:hypothetical protein
MMVSVGEVVNIRFRKVERHEITRFDPEKYAPDMMVIVPGL